MKKGIFEKAQNQNRKSSCVWKIQRVLFVPMKVLSALLYLSRIKKQYHKNIAVTHGENAYLRVKGNKYVNFQFPVVSACLLRVTIVSKDFSDL